MSRPLFVVKTGCTIPEIAERRGDFENWIVVGMGLDPTLVTVVDVQRGGELPDPARVAGVVVTGSPAMVTSREPWSVRTAAWLRGVVDAELPVLGICYGHQLLADALGGKVGSSVSGREVGTVAVDLTLEARSDRLFSVMNQMDQSVVVHTTHEEAVVTLPPGAVRLARNDHTEVQAFRAGDTAWGVQFHPEFDADIMRGYIVARRSLLQAEGHEVEALLRGTKDTDYGPRLLRRFADIACERQSDGPGISSEVP
jgi:GMP synthase (glutamine-hydrolysing)